MRSLILLVVVGMAASHPHNLNPDRFLFNEGMFEGDIKGVAGQKPGEERSAIVGEYYRWPSGVVPYDMSSVSSEARSIFKGAMAEIERKTCVRFVDRNLNPAAYPDYIYITTYNSGCWSYVGRMGGRQEVSLQTGGCTYHGTALHEIMHAIGFFHEHNRQDRDSYVKIYYENVEPSMAYNFDKEPNSMYVGENYNYYSIMHYDTYAFSIQWGVKKTIVPLQPGVELIHVAYKNEMEQSDANQIKNLYKC
ncbi:astacin-like [Oratosquilla oratoria]|uniref:astacin-like n=1 Tax=Oratosquilla oratoria TaxID=337810 RepID=UPI003F76AA01